MRAVVQRVSQAQVKIKQKVVSKINHGFLILLGVGPKDTQEDVSYLVKKISKLRIMADKNGLMNLSLDQVDGEILVVSQFTLYGEVKKGNRPSFIKAAKPKKGERLYNQFVSQLKKTGLTVKTGKFSAYMKVSLVNDGPVTIIIDTKEA